MPKNDTYRALPNHTWVKDLHLLAQFTYDACAKHPSIHNLLTSCTSGNTPTRTCAHTHTPLTLKFHLPFFFFFFCMGVSEAGGGGQLGCYKNVFLCQPSENISVNLSICPLPLCYCLTLCLLFVQAYLSQFTVLNLHPCLHKCDRT